MDKSWQNKCSSSWPSSDELSLPQQVSQNQNQNQNQVEMSASNYFYPYGQGPHSMDRGFLREPMLFNTSNIVSCRSGKPEIENSFLALLSGPSPQLQSGIQVSSSKSVMASGRLPMHRSTILSNNEGRRLLSQHQGSSSMGNGLDGCPVAQSTEASISTCNHPSGFNDIEMTNLTRITDLNKVAPHSLVYGNETGTYFSSPQWGWLVSSNPTTEGQHATSTQASLKVASVTKSAVPDPLPFVRGRPRVFCLAKGGDLLISNTGLIGVICSCHGLQMSISKFCEHSGLCAVNPGNAVRLESGETVTQWRRLYFPKLGIRIPDDNSGWDWPEKFPATGGLVKCNTTVQNTPKNSDFFQLPDPSVVSARSRQCWNNLGPPKNPNVGANIREKTSSNIHCSQQRNAPEGCNILKGLIGTAHNNLPPPLDVRTMHPVTENPISSGSAPSRSPLENSRDNNGYQSISEYIDFLTKGGNPAISNQSLGKLKFHDTNSDVNGCNSSREAYIGERNGISSNIELRLGQPSQQSHALDVSVISAVQPQPLSVFPNFHKSPLHDPVFHNFNPGVFEESRQNLLSAPSNNSSSKRPSDSQLNLMQLMPRSHNVTEAPKSEQFMADIAKNSQISTVISHLISSEANVQSWDSSSMVNCNEPFMSRVLSGESHNINGPSGFVRNTSGRMDLNNTGPGHLNRADKGKGTQFIADNRSYDASKEKPLSFNKQMVNPSFFTGAFNGNILRSNAFECEKQGCYWRQSSGTSDKASGINNLSSQLGNVSSLGSRMHLDHSLLRLINSSTVNDGQNFPLSALSTSFSSTSSTCRPNMMPSLSNKESCNVSPHFQDENLRLLALRRIVDSSKQDPVIAYREMVPEQRRVYAPSTIEVQRRGRTLDPSAPEQQKEQPYLTINHDAPEFSMQQLHIRRLDGAIEKLADVAGVNNWCNFSPYSEGILFHSKEDCIHHPPAHDPRTDKQPLLRLGRIENNPNTSGEHERCSQKEPRPNLSGKSSCPGHSIYLAGDCVSRGAVPNAGKANGGRASGGNPEFVASIFDNGHGVQVAKAIGRDHCEKLKRQIPKQTRCHASQWRDVPRKRSGVPNAIATETPTAVTVAKANVEDQSSKATFKGFNETGEAESLNEQQMSNVCSGFSAPAVTEVTVEVNNMDSCTVEAADSRYINDHVIDEESGIEKCCSSNDALESERSTDTVNISRDYDLIEGGSSSGLPMLSSNGFSGKIRSLNSFGLKKLQNPLPVGSSVQGSIKHTQKFKGEPRNGKKRKTTKWKRLDASFLASIVNSLHVDSPRNAELQPLSSRGTQSLSQPNHGLPKKHRICSTEPSGLKRKRSALSSAKILSQKRDLYRLDDHHREWEEDGQALQEDHTNNLKISKLSGRKRSKKCRTLDASISLQGEEINHVDAAKTSKFNSLSGAIFLSGNQVNKCAKKTRPVACGKSGILSNGKLTEGRAKHVKIVSLSTILKSTRRCALTEPEELLSVSETNETCFSGSKRCNDKPFVLEGGRDIGNYNDILTNEVKAGSSVSQVKKGCSNGNKICVTKPSILESETDIGPRMSMHNFLHSNAPLKSRFKEARKRSLSELGGKGKDIVSGNFCENETSKFGTKLKSHRKSCLKKADSNRNRKGESCKVITKMSVKEHRSRAFVQDSDAFCCVCGSSDKDETNCLLECQCCSIRVHQACYGVSRVPKGPWSCRPCRVNSKNNVCVLCGYEGGAMTRALRSRNIVKGLLKAWSIPSGSKLTNFAPLSETSRDELKLLSSPISGNGGFNPEMKLIDDQTAEAVSIDERVIIKISDSLPNDFQIHNTITAGVLDPTIKQWVHMVCGLWTPGTRCPNVDTMSTFDVSGAQCLPKDVVCSLCSRPGGSCIECRVVNCSVHFHPWCALQKGLLQSEVEGIDNDKVGFYGRCVLHATFNGCNFNVPFNDTRHDTLGRGEYTCARIEGYKGRKKDGFRHNLFGVSGENGGCLVPQEQINAWLHINRQKSRTRVLVKPPASDIEYDCRKEYARYKQRKGWKHLVVYKSGIHGLGLYTSQFICRGAMVVEYVGEIVGLRVADKREVEYHSGRKLPYKSACYFFRIDKEHIIDATRKGGIARFVNHSCLPNCVAKIISVRNVKKVVFFAERDINPGEEITYDYHFSHEDEGKKIPCFCNSKNCRRYLN